MASLNVVKLCYECIHAEMDIQEKNGERVMVNTGICRALGFKPAYEVYDSTLCRFAYKEYDKTQMGCGCGDCHSDSDEDGDNV